MGIEYLDAHHAKLVVTRGSGSNRERKIKRITYKNKRDAKRQYDAFVASVNFDVDDKMTVGELVDWYIKRFADAGGKDTTITGYCSCQRVIADYFKRTKAKDVTLSQIETFIRKQNTTPKTTRNRVSLLRSAYTAAIRRGLLNQNPCQYAELPKQNKPDVTILNQEQISYFVSVLEPLDFKVACELALFCGLRRSEIMGLKKEDVTDVVVVNKVRHRMKGKDVIETPKTKNSTRTLAVPKFLQDDIILLKEKQKNRPSQSEFLILNGFGEPVTGDWLKIRRQRLLKKHNLPPITMHGLRHTYASMLINAGIPIAEVSTQLGHASIDITLRTYTHLFTDASTASKRISDYLDGIMAPELAPDKKKEP